MYLWSAAVCYLNYTGQKHTNSPILLDQEYYLCRKPKREDLESDEFRKAQSAKAIAAAEVDKVTNKDDPLTSFSFAVQSFSKKSKQSK